MNIKTFESLQVCQSHEHIYAYYMPIIHTMSNSQIYHVPIIQTMSNNDIHYMPIIVLQKMC